MPLSSTARRSLAPLVLGAGLLGLPACSSGSGGDGAAFVIRTTTRSIDGASPVEVTGIWMVYLADEGTTGAGGTDLNGDGDVGDQVAIVVRLNEGSETNLGVAALAAKIVGDQVYLLVDEADDGTDWSGANGTGDLVVLHWSRTAGAVTFVDVASPETLTVGMLTAGGRLYYAAEAVPVGDETTLRYLDTTNPTTPTVVENQVGVGTLRPVPMASVNGLLFLLLDETEEGADQNGDGDATDLYVLALLDGTDPAERVKNVGLAVRDESAPVAARSFAAGDWLVAFLVDESAQGGVSLNDPASFTEPLLPDSCAAVTDLDAADEVLHALDFADFLAGLPNAVLNTGLAGRDRVVVVSGFVATLSEEADLGCDLNEDGDTTDSIARWVGAALPIMPPRDPSQMHAVQESLPGGSQGLARLGERLVAVVSEDEDGRNLDGKAADHDLVGWLDPALGFATTWDFSHQHPGIDTFGTGVFACPTPPCDSSNGTSEPFAGCSWMAGDPLSGRLGLTFLEEVPGTNANVSSLNNNLDCNLFPKDADKTDALPVWADFETGPTLDFDGLGYAVDPANAGIVIAGGFAFFRVSEADDSRDYNNDGVANDFVLMRNPLTQCSPVAMATSSSVAGPVIVTDGSRGAAFLSSEFQAGIDFNGDGDSNDLVVRYFLF